MKKTLLVLSVLLVIVVVVSAQETKPKAELLTSKTWTLKNQVMVGIGTHRSLPDGTEISFATNGKWKSSQPIEGEKEGIWELSDNILEMTFGSKAETIKYRLTFISETSLLYKTFLKTAHYKFEWSAK